MLSSSPPTIQIKHIIHHLQLPRTRRKIVRSSFVSARGGRRATASSRSSEEKTMEVFVLGVLGKKT